MPALPRILRDPTRLGALDRVRYCPPEDETLERLTRLATRLLSAPQARIALFDEDGIVLQGTTGDGAPCLPLHACACREILREGGVVAIEDAAPGTARHPLVPEGMVACLAVPLKVDGQVVGAFCVLDREARRWTEAEHQDLTDLAASAMSEFALRAAGEALQLEQARLQAIFEQAPAFLATARGPDHVFERANPLYRQLVGERPLVGRAVREALPEVVEQGLADRLDEVYRTGVPFVARELTVGLRREPEGPLEERVLTFVYQALRDASGSPAGVMALGVDVTEEVAMRRRLQDAEAHYRRLVSTAPYPVFVLDTAGSFLELNPAGEALLGHPAGALLGHHFTSVVAPDDLPLAAMAFLQASAAPEAPIEVELRVVRPDGGHRLLRVRGVGIPQAAGVGVHGIALDLTEDRAREARLRRVERLASMGTMLGGVAHELNNPLTAVAAFTELMLAGAPEGALAEDLRTVRREVARMARLVANLRTVARRSGSSTSIAERVDLNDVIRHILRIQAMDLQASEVQVFEELALQAAVQADPTEVEQVVLNLVVNAEQAMQGVNGRRRLTLRTFLGEDTAGVRVEDTGTGIAPEHLPRLFDPFFTTKPPGQGTGLGLSLAHGLVTHAGGEILVESRPGRGAAFTIHWPRAKEAGLRRARPTTTAASRPLRVLVVDDEPTIRRSLARFLRRRGHEVQTAADGLGARDRLDEATFDVVVSDLRMPGMGGVELLALLQARLGPEPRVIFMSGDPRGHHDVAGVPLLPKPFDLADIAALVEAA